MPSMTTMGIGLDMSSLSYQRLSAWARARLDACLSESLRQSSPVELSRARLLVGILGMLLLLDLLVLLFFSARQQRPWLAGAVELLCLVAFLGMLWSLRRVSSIRLPALGVCSFVSLAMMFEAHRSGSQAVAVNVMTMLVPMLTVYLLGVRWGLLFSVLSATYMGLVHPQAFPPSNNLGLNLFSALFLLCGWLVSWMFLASRDEAHAALERALRTMHESERKLISLVESTDDPVCSLDTRGRVLTFNQAGHELCRQLFGGEPPRNTALFDMLAPEQRALWKERVERTLDGQRVRFQVDTVTQGQTRVMDISLNPILGSHGHPVGMTLFGRDITALKEAEARLGELHRNLMDVSRRAGMAEMATGILHNVGNTLNSVNVSAGLIAERLRGLRVSGVTRAAGLLREHAHDLAAFFTSDSRGRQIPAYMETLAQQLTADQEALLAETRALHQSIDHIKAVVSMQQRQARCSEVLERVPVPRLLDDALRLNAVSFERLGIQVRTEYASVEPVLVDRHKLLQVLLNLLSNARHALLASDRTDKQLSLRVAQSCPGRLRIEVADNGVGISPENMRRLFTQGFTTKKNGHGFGLHISALAATEMGGALTCRSEGRGLGATFTVELPFEGKEAPRRTPPVGYRTWDGSSGTTHR
jgi:PAS domain S-box-containing protein